MMNLIKSIKSMLKNKSGKISLSREIENNNHTQSDREFEDIMWNIVFLPANIVYRAGKGIYNGIKNIYSYCQNYKEKGD